MEQAGRLNNDHWHRPGGTILSAIGGTPLLRLRRMVGNCWAEVWAKDETANPGGSVKSRASLAVVEAAEAMGLLLPGTIIVEPAFGAMGVSMALVAAAKGYRAIIVVPGDTCGAQKAMIKAYGASLLECTPGKSPPETRAALITKALKVAEGLPRTFIPSLFPHDATTGYHKRTTALEILCQCPGTVDAFVTCVGSGASLTGIGQVLKEANPEVLVVAVSLEGHVLPGSTRPINGAHLSRAFVDQSLIDRVIEVSEEDARNTSQALARLEGVLAGLTSGANVWAALEVARALGSGKRVVVILPDPAYSCMEPEPSCGHFGEEDQDAG